MKASTEQRENRVSEYNVYYSMMFYNGEGSLLIDRQEGSRNDTAVISPASKPIVTYTGYTAVLAALPYMKKRSLVLCFEPLKLCLVADSSGWASDELGPHLAGPY